MDAIQVLDVSHRHSSRTGWVLDGISFSLSRESGITGLLGENGAGKSTLMDCLSGVTKPERGNISILGHEAGTIAAKQVTGVSYQSMSFPSKLKVREIIGSVFTLRGFEVSSSMIRRWAEEYGLLDTLHGYAGNLSGGRQKMLQNLLAMAWKPSVLLLDEPSAGLDFGARQRLWEQLRDARQRETCILISSHTLEEIDTLCDGLLWLYKGHLTTGNKSEILHNVRAILEGKS